MPLHFIIKTMYKCIYTCTNPFYFVRTWWRLCYFRNVSCAIMFCLCCPIMCFYVLSSVLWCPFVRFRMKTMKANILFTLFLFPGAYSYPTHIVLCFCFVFLRLVYPMLSVSLGCLFVIVSSVFSNVYWKYAFLLSQRHNRHCTRKWYDLF